jgi:hypothetical protein
MIEECIRGAQRSRVGTVVYFRKEGRALGEGIQMRGAEDDILRLQRADREANNASFR